VSINPALSLVDAHCHLNFTDFDNDRILVIERARGIGISRILIPAIDLVTSRSALKFASQFPEVFAAVGVHPNSGMTWTKETLSEIKLMADETKVVAIGEIGLDYYRDHTPKEVQRKILIQQLELAADLGLPVIIHNRDATDDIVDILRDWYVTLKRIGSKLVNYPGEMHSYSAGLDTARMMVDLNFKLGITGPVTFRNSQLLQSVVISLPLESLLLETDAPYLTPDPYRGKRNEPANVRIVAEKIAELKNCSPGLVAKITTESADQLFDWRVMH